MRILPPKRVVRLKNETCPYCGTVLSDCPNDIEHTIGRRFVPKGKLDGCWNLILRACLACNHRKGQLEDDRAWANISNAIRAAAVAAGIVGLVDASVGWAASWALGAGQLPEGTQLTATRWIVTAIFVAIVAAAIGALGGIAGRRSASRGVAV